jgi:hypothetical protein
MENSSHFRQCSERHSNRGPLKNKKYRALPIDGPVWRHCVRLTVQLPTVGRTDLLPKFLYPIACQLPELYLKFVVKIYFEGIFSIYLKFLGKFIHYLEMKK